MSGRELVILLLGLAIVAVVLRGLYVAINARRGQLRLAIDKNIPQDVDLESLELAELPGGGARVVTRSLEEVNRQNNALDLAETRAKSLNLADANDDEHIPVLMDAVELSASNVARSASRPQMQRPVETKQEPVPAFAGASEADDDYGDTALEEYDDDDVEEERYEELEEELEEDFSPIAASEHSFGESWEDEEEAAEEDDYSSKPQQAQDADTDELTDTDAVLFDYDQEGMPERDARSPIDAMRSVAPDYGDEADEVDAEDEYSDDEGYEDDASAVELSEGDVFSDQHLEDDEEESEVFDADSTVDNFSMTAGERIGGKPVVTAQAGQTGLFDDVDAQDEAVGEPNTGRSLFSLFGRKSKQKERSLDAESLEEDAEGAFIDDEPVEPPPEDEYRQLETDEADYDEDGYEESDYEDERVAELEQKPAAKIEPKREQGEARRSAEFEHSEVLVLNVTAKQGRVFSGDDLLHGLITAGLKFGDMNIFHKRLSKDRPGSVIFSVANMLNPGTFDLNNMDEFTTLGISFFLALPSPINNLDAFEQMLGVAQQIRATLDGDLKDDHRNGMTGQTIEHYRQRVRDFELRRLKAGAARG